MTPLGTKANYFGFCPALPLYSKMERELLLNVKGMKIVWWIPLPPNTELLRQTHAGHFTRVSKWSQEESSRIRVQNFSFFGLFWKPKVVNIEQIKKPKPAVAISRLFIPSWKEASTSCDQRWEENNKSMVGWTYQMKSMALSLVTAGNNTQVLDSICSVLQKDPH